MTCFSSSLLKSYLQSAQLLPEQRFLLLCRRQQDAAISSHHLLSRVSLHSPPNPVLSLWIMSSCKMHDSTKDGGFDFNPHDKPWPPKHPPQPCQCDSEAILQHGGGRSDSVPHQSTASLICWEEFSSQWSRGSWEIMCRILPNLVYLTKTSSAKY